MSPWFKIGAAGLMICFVIGWAVFQILDGLLALVLRIVGYAA